MTGRGAFILCCLLLSLWPAGAAGQLGPVGRHCDEGRGGPKVECASPNEVDWLVRYYKSYAHPMLGPEQRLTNRVAWRLHYQSPLGLAMPRITRMADRNAMARANRLFDAMHAELILEYARQAVENRSFALGEDALISNVTPLYFARPTTLTYASRRLVSYTEAIIKYTGGTSLGTPVQGRVLDLESERVFSMSSCPKKEGFEGLFVLGELLEICDDAAVDAFETLWRKALDLVAASPALKRDPLAAYCKEAMPERLYTFTVYLTETGLAVHTMSFFPNSAKWDCTLNKTVANPVIIPYRELAPLMKAGAWRDELLEGGR